MTATTAERLSTLDAFFLEAEHHNAYMHIGATLVFEEGRFRDPPGGVDIEKIRAYVASRLHLIPRYRQRLARTPLEGRPIWVDDADFDVANHVLRSSPPRPGNQRQLKQAVSELLSQPLDRNRPLWQLSVLDGLENGRFAVVSKLHHSMADGLGGVEQLAALLSPSPETDDEPPRSWVPRPRPGTIELLADEAASTTRSWVEGLRTIGQALREPRQSWQQTRESAFSLADALRTTLAPAAKAPFNCPIGPARRVEWLRFEMEEVLRVKHALGGTLNDVVLATVAGALRRYFRMRRFTADSAEIRAAVPVNMRDADSASGNQVSIWFVPLPVDESDATWRLSDVRIATSRLKASHHAQGLYSFIRIADRLNPALVRAGIRVVERLLPFNLIVTNVPGPRFPLYMSGARLVAAYPTVPLFGQQGLGIALFSYDGILNWGFLADPEMVPDLEELAYAVTASFRELLDRARAGDAWIARGDFRDGDSAGPATVGAGANGSRSTGFAQSH
ncbi:MAG: WS/DGAT/MGAT family O-acyltransferase [Candidatus Binatia bacterium]